MSIQMVGWVLDQNIPDPGMKLLLISLANAHNNRTGQCNPGIDVLVHESSLSRSSVIRKIKALELEGWIAVEPSHDSNGRQTSNAYKINQGVREGVTMTPSPERTGEGVSTDTGEGVIAVTPTGVSTVTPTVEPEEEPEKRTSPLPPEGEGAAAPGRGFSNIWSAWDYDHLPENRPYAEKQFANLTPEEQGHAIEQVKSYRILCAQRGKPCQMVPYLKERRFLELVDAPERDSDGDWIIIPTRPEWKEWMGWARRTHGQKGVDSFVKLGRCVTKTRWPEGHPNGKTI